LDARGRRSTASNLEAGMVMLLLMESNGQLTKPFPQAEKFRDAA
jgi:hypothetical protein